MASVTYESEFPGLKEGPTRRWIAALRSGDYGQASGRLRDKDGMCCLGVACDVFAPQRWELQGLPGWDPRIPGEVPRVWVYKEVVGDEAAQAQGSVLAIDHAKRLGISTSGNFRFKQPLSVPGHLGFTRGIYKLNRLDPSDKIHEANGVAIAVVNGIFQMSLTQLNDSFGFEFSDIADVLEASLAHPDLIDFRDPWSPVMGERDG